MLAFSSVFVCGRNMHRFVMYRQIHFNKEYFDIQVYKCWTVTRSHSLNIPGVIKPIISSLGCYGFDHFTVFDHLKILVMSWFFIPQLNFKTQCGLLSHMILFTPHHTQLLKCIIFFKFQYICKKNLIVFSFVILV